MRYLGEHQRFWLKPAAPIWNIWVPNEAKPHPGGLGSSSTWGRVTERREPSDSGDIRRGGGSPSQELNEFTPAPGNYAPGKGEAGEELPERRMRERGALDAEGMCRPCLVLCGVRALQGWAGMSPLSPSPRCQAQRGWAHTVTQPGPCHPELPLAGTRTLPADPKPRWSCLGSISRSIQHPTLPAVSLQGPSHTQSSPFLPTLSSPISHHKFATIPGCFSCVLQKCQSLGDVVPLGSSSAPSPYTHPSGFQPVMGALCPPAPGLQSFFFLVFHLCSGLAKHCLGYPENAEVFW